MFKLLCVIRLRIFTFFWDEYGFYRATDNEVDSSFLKRILDVIEQERMRYTLINVKHQEEKCGSISIE